MIILKNYYSTKIMFNKASLVHIYINLKVFRTHNIYLNYKLSTIVNKIKQIIYYNNTIFKVTKFLIQI